MNTISVPCNDRSRTLFVDSDITYVQAFIFPEDDVSSEHHTVDDFMLEEHVRAAIMTGLETNRTCMILGGRSMCNE